MSGPEDVGEAYERLGAPATGRMIEAYWPATQEWLLATFVALSDAGTCRVKWLSDGSVSDVPFALVQKLGGDSAGERAARAPPVALPTVLRGARPDWQEDDVRTVAGKLARVGIGTPELLLDALVVEGVNRRLRAGGERALAAGTLGALRRQCERVLLLPAAAPAESRPRAVVAQEAAGTSPTRSAASTARPELLEEQGPCAEPGSPPKGLPPEVGGRAAGTEDTTDTGSDSVGRSLSFGGSSLAEAEVAQAGAAQVSARPPAGPRQEAQPPPPPRPEAAHLAACQAGHVLRRAPVPYPACCDTCGEELDLRTVAWRCAACAFDVCEQCQRAQLAG